MTVGVLAVLGALLDRPDTELYGLEIVRASGLEPGTIYPILQRLRAAGWVSDRWEDGELAHTERRQYVRSYRRSVPRLVWTSWTPQVRFVAPAPVGVGI